MSNLVAVLIGGLCLAACLLIPVLYFQSRISMETYRAALLAASVGWFLCAGFFVVKKESKS